MVYSSILDKGELIDISKGLDIKNLQNCFVKKMIVADNLVYFVCDINCEILCLNMNTMQINIVDSWEKDFFMNTGIKECVGMNTGGDVCIVGESFWVPINYDNYILEVNMRTQKTIIYKIDCPPMRFYTICFDGENFWMTGYRPIIVKWKIKSKCVEVFENFPGGFLHHHENDCREGIFSRSFYEDGYVYLFPLMANMALKIKTETDQIEKMYQWDTEVSCFTVEKWDTDVFYVETGSSSFIDTDESMLIDIHGSVIKRNVFTILLDEIKYSFRKTDNVVRETMILTIKNLF